MSRFCRALLCSLALCGSLSGGLSAAQEAPVPPDGSPPALLDVPIESMDPPQATPEPNTALLAGIGGLVLLLVAFRRK